MKKISKAVLLGFTALFISLFPIIQLVVSSDLFRIKTTEIISQNVPGEVQINAISFGFIDGFLINGFLWRYGKSSSINVDKLLLDIHWLDLINGSLTIKEILIDGSRIDLKQAELDIIASNSEPAAPEEKEKPQTESAPTFPIRVDLKAVRLAKIYVDFSPSTSQQLQLQNFALDTAVKLNEHGVDLRSIIKIDEFAFKDVDKTISTPISMLINLKSDLAAQQIHLGQSNFKLGDTLHLNTTAQITGGLKKPKIDFTISQTKIVLTPLLHLLKPWLPKEYQQLYVAGEIMPSISIKGEWLKSGFTGIVNSDFTGTKLNGGLPSLKASGQLKKIKIRVKDLDIKRNEPQNLNTQLSLNSASGQFENYKVHDLNINLDANQQKNDSIKARLKLNAKAIEPDLPEMPGFTTPLKVSLAGLGNIKQKSLNIEQLDIELEKLLSIVADAKSYISNSKTQERNIKGNITTTIYDDKALKLLPPNLLTDITIIPLQLGGSTKIQTKIATILDKNMQPITLQNQGSITMAGLRVEQVLPPSTMEFSGLDVKWQAAKPKADTQYNGDIEVGLKKLHLEDQQSSINIPNLAINTKARAKLLSGDYYLDNLQITADKMVDLKATGSYSKKSDRFKTSINLNKLALSKMGNLIYNNGVALFGKASGKIALAATASGKLSHITNLKPNKLPIKAKLKLSGRNVSGAWQKNRVTGADMDISILLSPKNQNKFTLKSQIKAQEINLNGSPQLSQIKQPSLKIAMESKGMDRVKISQLETSIAGAKLSTTGAISGLKPILTGEFDPKNLMGLITPMFIELNSKVLVDLNKQKPLLQSLKMDGAGKTSLKLNLLKKEQGDVQLKVLSSIKNVSIKQPGLKLYRGSGDILLRKTLAPASDKKIASGFSMAQAITAPISLAGGKKGLHIQSIDVAGQRLDEISAQIGFLENVLRVQNLSCRLLGGTMAGDLMVQGGTSPTVRMNLEGVSLKLNKLLPSADQIPGDSRISFVSRNSFIFQKEDGQIDWGGSELTLIFTKIGREATDRLLLSLDPKQSNPAIINARSKINLANPSRLRFQLLKGIVKLQIDFNDGLLSSLKIDRIPMGVLGSFDSFKELLAPVAQLTQLLKLMGASQFNLDDNENLLTN
jgi:hypothetical protein